MSHGLGTIGRLVLAAIAYADERPDLWNQDREYDGWWLVRRIGRVAAWLADEPPASVGARGSGSSIRSYRAGRFGSFSSHATMARGLAILARRGLVERDAFSRGSSRVRLTAAGRSIALLELEKHLERRKLAQPWLDEAR
jgi:hypothetical protein